MNRKTKWMSALLLSFLCLTPLAYAENNVCSSSFSNSDVQNAVKQMCEASSSMQSALNSYKDSSSVSNPNVSPTTVALGNPVQAINNSPQQVALPPQANMPQTNTAVQPTTPSNSANIYGHS